MLVDLTMVARNIDIAKRGPYELNRHFQDNWAMKFPWAKYVLVSNGKVVQV
jgi:hypothetical protein